jgi:hypothetical protein
MSEGQKPIPEQMREEQAEQRKQRKRTMILVSVPGFPPQDPGRLMLWEPRSTPAKAAREIKRLQQKMPEYVWTKELLTNLEAQKIKYKPFDSRALYARNRGEMPAAGS